MKDITRKEFLTKMQDPAFMPNVPLGERSTVASLVMKDFRTPLPEMKVSPSEENVPAFANLPPPQLPYIINLMIKAGKHFGYFMQDPECKHQVLLAISSVLQQHSYAGSSKNDFVMSIYDIFMTSSGFSIHNAKDRETFLTIYSLATYIKMKNENESLCHVLLDLFSKKESIDLDFFKELLAIYVEKVTIPDKYENKLKKVLMWAKKEDFSSLSANYHNIRHYFTPLNEIQSCLTSVKQYRLKELAKLHHVKEEIVEKRFNSLTSFLHEKIHDLPNIETILTQDRIIYQQLFVIHHRQDPMVHTILDFYDIALSKHDEAQKEEVLLKQLWESLIFKDKLQEKLPMNSPTGKYYKI